MSNKTPTIAKELAHLEHVPFDSLFPFQDNLKDLSEREYGKLKKSILENGVITPFYVWVDDKGRCRLNDGHQRHRVFNGEGWQGMDVPIIRIAAKDRADAKQKLLVVSSQYGKITQEGWDAFTYDLPDDWIKETVHFDALPFVFGDFEPPDGGNEGDDKDAEPQTNRAEELREEWGVETGQLWRLPSRTPGQEHRLICGDCTDTAVVERLLGGDTIDLQLTDPPYGISVVQIKNGASGSDGAGSPVTVGAIRAHGKYPFGGKKNMVGTVGADHWVDATPYAPVVGDDQPFDPSHLLEFDGEKIIFGGNYFASKLPDSRCWLVWDKNNTGNFADAELAWTSFKTGVKLYSFTWNGLVREGERRLEGVKRVHPTQKPVGLFSLILGDYSKEGWVVADFYHGAGATLLACENTGRVARCAEITTAYVAVALQRYRDAFGIEPELVN